MPPKLTLKFDPNQEHQLRAIESVLNLFEGLPENAAGFRLGDEVVPNLPPYEALEENWLLGNLIEVQRQNGLQENMMLDADDGLELEGVGLNSWRYPLFTIEMETGTGKTYVYLRTILELKKHYGFRKFIVIVPSIAIYEGVIKNFQITREHFKSLYGNETVGFTEYEGQQISKLRHFAASGFLEIMVMTIDSFNKSSNLIFKATEKLPGEKLPFQYIQETRPILILDESQNYTSAKSKEALRTLNPLLALKYTATPREITNLVYRLTPVDAFQKNLVKKIEVFGVKEEENLNQPFLALEKIEYSSYGPTAKLRTLVNDKGERKEAVVTLRKGDDLFQKTKMEGFAGKNIIVQEINRRDGVIVFSDESQLSVHDTTGMTHSKEETFRVQIEETVRRHLQRQTELLNKGIKVLSLFFIDKVANYTGENALIPRLFDAAFDKEKHKYPYFEKLNATDIREAYFARKKTKSGEVVAIDTEGRNQAERELEKAAFELIMKNKEQLLSFNEKVCFIFAHSALKEGWDNPNVFQICTLRDTLSELRKRQEIGRGLRLCVDQEGERINNEDINTLTVVANESYEAYVAGLQAEYRETGDIAPPPPSNARKTDAKRNEKIFRSKDFQKFWEKLNRKTDYFINVDTEKLIEESILHLNATQFPEPQITVTRGRFVITEFTITLLAVEGDAARLNIVKKDTGGDEESFKLKFKTRDDLAKIARDDRLRGFRLLRIKDAGEDSEIEFDNGKTLRINDSVTFHSEKGQRIDSRSYEESQTTYPVFNLIERTIRETSLTRPTVLRIFRGIRGPKKELIFKNPEGFAGVFLSRIKQVLANHIAERIEYVMNEDIQSYNLEEIFPKEKKYPQKELLEGTTNSLYSAVQIDSEVEKKFVEQRLQVDDHNGKIILYFKFPNSFKVNVPKIIGNYVPDWGVVRLSEDGKYKLELVRETKGNIDPNLLQYPQEKRKIDCAKKHFAALGIDYRQVTADMPYWWEKER